MKLPRLLLFIICYILSSNVTSYSQWQPDVRLTNNSAGSSTSFNNAWCIAASGNFLNAVWFDSRDGNYEIYYKRSTDNGISWDTDTRLTFDPLTSQNPCIVAKNQYIHILWNDYRNGNWRIYYKRSINYGLNWSADTQLVTNAQNYDPSLAFNDSILHAVWEDNRDGNLEIYYKRSTDGGVSWGIDTRLTNASANSIYPSISVTGLYVHTVWYDERDGNREIYYKRSTDGGNSWGADIRLTNNSGISEYPCISVSGQVVHVVWYDHRDGNAELYYKRSTDGGASWGTDIRITNDPDFSNRPSISVSGQVVHVVWYDYRDGNYEIYYKRSTDEGINWGADTRLTNAITNSELASICFSGSVVHVIWTDSRDGNPEIYYKRNPTGNLVAPLAPTNLTALAVSTSRINLNWTDNSNNETGFKIERSTNAGTNWMLKDSVIQNIFTYADSGLAANTIYHYRIYAYNPVGNSPYSNIAFDTTFNAVGIISNEEIPKVFKLYSNFPNPFNPITKIKFALPKSSFSKLTIYDALGRELEILVNEQLSPGNYEISWNADMFSSGVYFYKLEADKFVEIKKMILLK